MSRIKNMHDESLSLHEDSKGMIGVRVKIPVRDLDDLTLAYSPGVAEPCLEINKNSDLLGTYTNYGNSVCVVTNGTAVLGLGNIGPKAAMPMAEGTALILKLYADIDALPICINSTDPGEIIEAIEMLHPTFAGVNLADIKAPECFEIESRLKKRGIFQGPIFHDDQHGAAIIILAALMNAMKVVHKKIEDVRIVIAGAGASGLATAGLLMLAGCSNIIICDSKGTIYDGRLRNMNPHKQKLAKLTNKDNIRGGLSEAIKGADVFIGVSAPNILTEGMVRSMAKDPVVFALANPIPEISPIQRATDAGAAVVASASGDCPNQLLDLLVFPGVFRGALDVRATDINDSMKIAAAYALAGMVAPDELGPDKIIPSYIDPNTAPVVASAVARAAMDTGVARIKVDPATVAENLRQRLASQGCA